jgi:hypothetical protein
MYGPGDKDKEARVEHIQKLPSTAKVLAISGEKDECLDKNTPAESPKGQQLWDAVVAGMLCTPAVKMHPKGGHGVFEGGKSGPVQERNAAAATTIVEWIAAEFD